MFATRADVVTPKVVLEKNLLTDQTATDLHYLLGSPVFDASYGHGISTATSVIIGVGAGGFPNQRMTTIQRYRTGTAQGSEYLGAIARLSTTEVAGVTNYVFARQHLGIAKLSLCLAGSFSNLDTASFALPQDEDVTIVLTCNDTAISASFTCTSLGTVNLAGTDSSVPKKGLMAYRSLSQNMWCRYFKAEQL